jgi:phosphoglycerate dehydrogenase-like enzyme
MPPGGILINVGRGSIVDEKALYTALRDEKLSAAGIDVWYNYPDSPSDRDNTKPSRFPFYNLDNIVMSPHRGGSTKDTEHLRMIHLAKSLNCAFKGNPIPNPVDLEVGY